MRGWVEEEGQRVPGGKRGCRGQVGPQLVAFLGEAIGPWAGREESRLGSSCPEGGRACVQELGCEARGGKSCLGRGLSPEAPREGYCSAKVASKPEEQRALAAASGQSRVAPPRGVELARAPWHAPSGALPGPAGPPPPAKSDTRLQRGRGPAPVLLSRGGGSLWHPACQTVAQTRRTH